MTSSINRNLVILLIAFSSICFGCAHNSKRSLADRELLALVAGNALSENIVQEIDSRGLAFRPTDGYRSQLADAGAGARKGLRSACSR
jgi:hypothetical protein